MAVVLGRAALILIMWHLVWRRQVRLTLGPVQVHKKGLVLQERGLPLQQLCVKLVDFGSAVHRLVCPQQWMFAVQASASSPGRVP